MVEEESKEVDIISKRGENLEKIGKLLVILQI